MPAKGIHRHSAQTARTTEAKLREGCGYSMAIADGGQGVRRRSEPGCTRRAARRLPESYCGRSASAGYAGDCAGESSNLAHSMNPGFVKGPSHLPAAGHRAGCRPDFLLAPHGLFPMVARQFETSHPKPMSLLCCQTRRRSGLHQRAVVALRIYVDGRNCRSQSAS
jgi:hypothetical protein